MVSQNISFFMNTDEISFQTVALVEFSFNLRGAKDVHPSVKAGRVKKEEGSFLQKVLVPMFYSSSSPSRGDQSECSSCQSLDQDGTRVRYM